jgi:hypothetical protein
MNNYQHYNYIMNQPLLKIYRESLHEHHINKTRQTPTKGKATGSSVTSFLGSLWLDVSLITWHCSTWCKLRFTDFTVIKKRTGNIYLSGSNNQHPYLFLLSWYISHCRILSSYWVLHVSFIRVRNLVRRKRKEMSMVTFR